MPLLWKLVGLYAVILAAVIGGICFGAPALLRRQLEQAMDAELAARAQAVGAATELEDGAWIVEGKSGIDEAFAAGRGMYYVVRDRDGAVLAASPLARSLGLADAAEELAARSDGSDRLTPFLLPAPHRERDQRAQPEGDARELWAGGGRYRQVAVRVTKSIEEDEPALRGAELRVVCGKDFRDVDFSIFLLVTQMAWLGPLVLLVSLAAGLVLVSRALRPIERMAATAAAIGANDLSRRLEVRGRDELARLGRTLNETFDRLQEAVERQRRFTADASHELRTPLAVVAGHADLALRRPRNVGEYEEAMAEIRAAGQRMQSVVDGLLTLARADAGVALGRDRVALQPLCEEVLLRHGSLAAERDVAIGFAGEDVSVPGDRDRLAELFGNLVVNAIRYNRRGGRVDVRLRRQDDMARVDVQDTGAGIAAEHLPHVFERFYRVDAHRSRERGGAGLGLAIAQWVARAHGGEITVASEPGRGSCFTVMLPAEGAGEAGATGS